MIIKPSKQSAVALLAALALLVAGCAGSEKNLATSESTALFLPVATDYGVDLFIDRLDGKPTEFGAFDQVTVDAGQRDIEVRLEYQPAEGSSLVVGGIGNLLLRAGTNKTFRTTMKVDVQGGREYRLIARAVEEKLEFIVVDETADREVQKQVFELKDGQLERIF